MRESAEERRKTEQEWDQMNGNHLSRRRHQCATFDAITCSVCPATANGSPNVGVTHFHGLAVITPHFQLVQCDPVFTTQGTYNYRPSVDEALTVLSLGANCRRAMKGHDYPNKCTQRPLVIGSRRTEAYRDTLKLWVAIMVHAPRLWLTTPSLAQPALL
ncbi:hypothetical protein MRX96_009308 [Rhipicephalus microplus]